MPFISIIRPEGSRLLRRHYSDKYFFETSCPPSMCPMPMPSCNCHFLQQNFSEYFHRNCFPPFRRHRILWVLNFNKKKKNPQQTANSGEYSYEVQLGFLLETLGRPIRSARCRDARFSHNFFTGFVARTTDLRSERFGVRIVVLAQKCPCRHHPPIWVYQTYDAVSSFLATVIDRRSVALRKKHFCAIQMFSICSLMTANAI